MSYELGRLQVHGGTALYDAVAEALPLAQSGHNRKKALVIISDGNDTGSRTDIQSLKRQIRETEVLIYAVGIDTQTEWGFQPTRLSMRMQRTRPRFPVPFPFPMPGGRNPPPSTPPNFPQPNRATTTAVTCVSTSPHSSRSLPTAADGPRSSGARAT